MSIQLSVAARNARLDAIEAALGAAPILTIRTGAAPDNCAAANLGTALATLVLPSDWMADAASGSKAMSGSWTDASADASGTAQHFRIHNAAGTVCHLQGTITGTGDGGDMTLDNITVTATQSVTITSFTLIDGNA
jgi:hypothetical protein